MNDRISMPSAMSSEAAERLSDVHGGGIPKWALEQASEDLVDRLKSGRTVGTLTLSDLVDSDLAGPRADDAAREVREILLMEYPDTPLYQGRYIDAVIERFLTTREELIRERAEEILADRGGE